MRVAFVWRITGGDIKTLTALWLGVFVAVSIAASSLTVVFNTRSHKYHYTSCAAAKRCTVNCVEIGLDEAVRRGGVPCRVCRPPESFNSGH